jgi:hypothetical protein
MTPVVAARGSNAVSDGDDDSTVMSRLYESPNVMKRTRMRRVLMRASKALDDDAKR